MGIEWFRDLSITILGFVTVAVLIFTAVLVFRLYRTIQSTLLGVNAVTKSVQETINLVQESIKPVLGIMSLIQGLHGGLQGIFKIFKKENSEGENSNE